MASINPYYTFEYSQPQEYRFSHDSVFLARKAYELVKDDVKPNWRVLDLCAGCGIVGMDFLFHCRNEQVPLPAVCDFLEVQSIYLDHFNENKKRLGQIATELNFVNRNYDHELNGTYDLIICNPPFFEVTQGKLSPSEFKNRCRFFIDSTKDRLITVIQNGLNRDGSALVLSKDLDLSKYAINLNSQKSGDIRGTPLFILTLKS